METALEEAPAGDDQVDGFAENAVKNAQGQCRVMKDALGSRHRRRAEGEHQIAPWTVTHAASVINRGGKDEEIFAVRRR